MTGSSHCPSCVAQMASDTVLCVECGYHTRLGRHLATSLETESHSVPQADGNPYASPSVDADSRGDVSAESELPPNVVRQVEAIVRASETAQMAWFFACCCGPVWLALTPWYAYHLWNWHRLRSRFELLQSPNSFSAHGALAVAFQDARWRLFVGVGIGAFIYAVLIVGYVLEYLDSR